MSTDSPEYAEAANREGVETPFLRPVELAQDGSSDFDYLYHATTWLRDHEAWQADIILRLPPTSPLCTPEHIDSCVRLLTDDVTADSARTVCEASKHPYKLWRAEGEYLVPFMSEEQIGLKDAHNLPRQSFPLVYQHVDVIALRWQTLVEQKSMAGTKIRYNVVPKTESVDIDNEVDFLVAEQLLRRRM